MEIVWYHTIYNLRRAERLKVYSSNKTEDLNHCLFDPRQQTESVFNKNRRWSSRAIITSAKCNGERSENKPLDCRCKTAEHNLRNIKQSTTQSQCPAPEEPQRHSPSPPWARQPSPLRPLSCKEYKLSLSFNQRPNRAIENGVSPLSPPMLKKGPARPWRPRNRRGKNP